MQWEDFSKQNAFTLLGRYFNEVPSFNDDIQGTGAVVLAGIQGALRISKEKLADQTFLIYGAGAAGIGVARQILTGLKAAGMPEDEACQRIICIDSYGLLHENRGTIEQYKLDFCSSSNQCQVWGFDDGGSDHPPRRRQVLQAHGAPRSVGTGRNVYRRHCEDHGGKLRSARYLPSLKPHEQCRGARLRI